VVDTYERHGDPAICSLALINLSRAYQCQQDYVNAFESLKRGTKLACKTGARVLLVEALLQEAALQLDAGQIEFALRRCKRALKDTRELGMKLHEARGLHILGRIHLAQGLYAQAELNMQESAALAKHINADYERGVALLCLAKLYGTRKGNGNSNCQCQRLLKQAAVIFRRMGADADVSRALQVQAELGQ
jgi:tetratricopeptide (TPR) repeat protein